MYLFQRRQQVAVRSAPGVVVGGLFQDIAQSAVGRVVLPAEDDRAARLGRQQPHMVVFVAQRDGPVELQPARGPVRAQPGVLAVVVFSAVPVQPAVAHEGAVAALGQFEVVHHIRRIQHPLSRLRVDAQQAVVLEAVRRGQTLAERLLRAVQQHGQAAVGHSLVHATHGTAHLTARDSRCAVRQAEKRVSLMVDFLILHDLGRIRDEKRRVSGQGVVQPPGQQRAGIAGVQRVRPGAVPSGTKL